jgi:hypothetical protein
MVRSQLVSLGRLAVATSHPLVNHIYHHPLCDTVRIR